MAQPLSGFTIMPKASETSKTTSGSNGELSVDSSEPSTPTLFNLSRALNNE